MIILLMKRPWIEKRLKQLDKTKSGLAEAMGLPPARVTEMMNGIRAVAVTELGPMSSFLQMHVAELLSALTKGTESIQLSQPLLEVRGRVQAGVWREAYEWPSDERYQVPMPIPERFRHLPTFGLLVGGDSMDEVYPEGAILICVPIDNYPDNLKSGIRVIVQRTRRSGEVEATVKEYVEDGPRKWLMARSRNPIYRAPIYFEGPEAESVEVLAVVVGYFKDEVAA